jgi:hypothetical protein
MLHCGPMGLPSRVRLLAAAGWLLAACGLSAKPTAPALPTLDASQEPPAGEAPAGVCFSFLACDPGDDLIGHGGYGTDPAQGCPAGRECYVLRWECGNTLCALPAGIHCSDPLVCAATEVTVAPADCFAPACHVDRRCGNPIACLATADAGAIDADGVVW